MTSAELIRSTRIRNGLSQERLARRTGTRQSAISRLERGDVSPSVTTLELLLNAMGERLEMSTVPFERSYDLLHRREMANRPPEERLELAISWNRLAGRLAQAGHDARSGIGDGDSA